MPGLIEWPARIKPAVTDIPAGVVDIFPTLVDLLQIKLEHPVPLDGISLLPLIDGQMKVRPRSMGFLQFAGNQQNLTPNSGPSAWNDNQYKLVKTKPNQWELFDVAGDRSEKSNIAAENPAVVNRMKAELENWQMSVIRSYQGEDYTPLAAAPMPEAGLTREQRIQW